MTGDETVKKISIRGGEEVLGKKRRERTRKAGGGRLTAPAPAPVPAAPTPVPVHAAPIPSIKTGGAPAAAATVKQVKLEPKKTKVILEKSKSRKATVAPHPTRKVRLAIQGIHKNIHKAKTIKNRASEKPIGEIKKELKAHGLWKEDSKAPESILRNIYSDFQILREKAL